MDGEGENGAPADVEADLLRIAVAASSDAAENLRRFGFEAAWAEGTDLLLRDGRTTVRLVNRVAFRPGARDQVHDLLARFYSRSISPAPTEPRS